MTTFKITNITHLLGKRGFKSNSELEVEYIDNMQKKTLKIKPQETVYIALNSLPLSIHRLRIKGLVTVNEISKKEMKTILAAEKQKESAKPVEQPKETKKKKDSIEEEKPEIEIEETKEDDKTEKKTTKKQSKKSEDKEDVE
jgi:hypothetical protein